MGIASENTRVGVKMENSLAIDGRGMQAALGGRLVRYSLMRLVTWPNLPQMSEVADEDLPLLARICALLAYKPTTASLIPLVLGVTEEKVNALLEALYRGRHVQIVGGVGDGDQAAAAEPSVASQEELSVAGKAQVSSIIGNIWQRLTKFS